MKNKILDGEKLTVAAPYDVASGAGMKVGNLFLVASTAAVSGANVSAELEGVFDLVKKPNDTFSTGDYAYWDNTNKYITSTSTSNSKVGAVVRTELAAGTTARVYLPGSLL